MKILILSLIFMAGCWADIDDTTPFDSNCGVITSKIEVGDVWITCYLWNDGSCDTILWHFDPVSMPGDTICKLQEVDLNDYNCKP